jgi:tetratricopeptide (TPR) repeat protein
MKRWHAAFAAVAFLVPLAVYLRTMTPTVPFWDSGEFIATSTILGLPHPPGNPVYTMLGRVMTFLPFETVAWRVNFMSVLASALTALFTFLVVARALRRWFGEEPLPVASWLACRVGGLVAAFLVAFSSSFWDSAIEAEVYSLSSLMIVVSIWLAWNWWERIGRKGNDQLLILIVYLLAVSTGVHLGTVLVAPGLLLLFMMVRPEYFFGDSRFWKSAALAGSLLVVLFLSSSVSLPPVVLLVGIAAAAALYAMYPRHLVKNNLFTWWTLALIVGFSVQFFLLLRSQQHPIINEGAPETWAAFRDYLLRKQYGPSNPFERRAEVWFQIDQMYFRYVGEQFRLVSRLGPFDAASGWVRLVNAIPYALLALGAVLNFRRDRKTFWFFFAQNLVMGPGLIFYLNFTDHEVRERDYFFTNSYHFLAIWMGMGAAGALEMLARAFAPESGAAAARAPAAGQAPAVGASPAAVSGAEAAPLPIPGPARTGVALGAVTLVGLSLLPMKVGWFTHDRSGFYIARDYAYNMLQPLAKDAVVFTNGDNDTFPLWYIQEVEGVRKDVRVINLSLLNTPWYIRQLRDQEPKVPITWTDAELARLEPYYDERNQKIVWVKDIAAAHIIQANEWRRPVYLAVTVPEQMGLESRLSLEGLVYRVHDREIGSRVIDVAKTMDNLYRVFHYRGLLDRNRDYDESVYKDENARRLVQNYSAAHVQVAYQLQQQRRIPEAIRLMADASRMTPEFPGVFEYLGRLHEDAGDLASAEQAYRKGMEIEPGAAEYPYLLGSLLYGLGHEQGNAPMRQEGIRLLRRAVELNQQFFDWYGALFSALWSEGERDAAVEVLRTWLRAHPEDTPRQAILQRYEDSLRAGGAAPGAGARR